MSRKSDPKREHYIPIMLLRRFTDENGLLHYFSKRFPAKGVLASVPEGLFFEKHLYNVQNRDGSKDVALERYYCEVEGLAEPVIEKIVTCARRSQPPNLTAQEREIFDVFFCTQWQRVPDVRDKVFEQEEIQSRLKRLVASFEAHARPLTEREARDLEDPKVISRIKQNAMIDAIKRPSPNILAVLKQKGLCIAVIRKPGKSFVIGSLPIVKMAYRGREHISDPTVETWLPLAFDVIVTPSPLDYGPEIFREIRDDAIVRQVNVAAYKQSTVIAGRSAKLIASLSHVR